MRTNVTYRHGTVSKDECELMRRIEMEQIQKKSLRERNVIIFNLAI